MADTVFVLGAGATRGGSFVDPRVQPCLPPLDRDFFTQLQRVRSHKHREMIDQVLKDVVFLFGKNFATTLETTFASIEQMIRMLRATRETREFRTVDLLKMRSRLLTALAAVFEEALTGEDEHGKKKPTECDHCRRFVSEILRVGDAIVTFNYDCVIDYHLKRYGSGKWNARYGYGLKLGPRGQHLKGDSAWQPDRPANRDRTVKLLKLHGSLHYRAVAADTPKYRVDLKQRPYTYQGRGIRFTIIPPEYTKRFDAGLFRDIWDEAFRAIARARNLVFVGYSLPMTDAHATALFRAAVRKEGLRALVIANPDQEARRRIRSVVLRGLRDDTRVLSLDSWSEFVAIPREVWDV